MKKFSQVLALFLCMIIILSTFPTQVIAWETNDQEGNVAIDEAKWEEMWDQYWAAHPDEWAELEAPNTSIKGTPRGTDTSLSAMYARAESLVNYQWTPSRNITTWNSNPYNNKTYFPSGSTVTGVPYTLFTNEVVTWSLCSLEQYKAVASKNYSDSAYCYSVGADRTGPVYGSCCADLVSEVFGGDFMIGSSPRYHSVGSLWNTSYGTTIHGQKMSDIRAGDAVSDYPNHNHIVWVGEVTDNTITIFEQTPPIARKLTLSKSSYTNSSGYFVYDNKIYSTITRSNDFIGTIGPHTCNKGEYLYYEAVHPHHNCYRCSICGSIWKDYSEPNYMESCLECQRPDQAIIEGLAEKYPEGENVSISWVTGNNTTHCNYWLYHWENEGWKTVNKINYATGPIIETPGVGEYRVLIVAYNSNYWEEDGSDWLHTYSDYSYFTVYGNHDCDKGEYVYFEATHPHCNCYRCSICGQIWRDNDSCNYVDDCPDCNKPLTFNLNGGYFSSTAVTEEINNFLGSRGTHEMTVFTPSGLLVDTNIYGYEVAVDSNGQVIAKRDYGDENHLTVPNGGFVLSAHGGYGEQKARFVFEIQIGDYVAVEQFNMTAYHYKDYEEYLANHKRVRPNENYGNLPIPKRNGYYFSGWITDNSGIVEYNTPFSSDTLSATWATDETEPSAESVYAGHLYERFEFSLSWEEAKTFCENRGGHLVSITSALEQVAVEELIDNGRKSIYFIGCSDEHAEGIWEWITGEQFSAYNNWDPQYPEPDSADGFNYGGIINLPIGGNKQFGEWLSNYNVPNDLSYNYRLCNYGFICEYEFHCRHRYEATIIPPTCIEHGYTMHTCTICGESYRDTYISALGHNYNHTVTTTPTTAATGVLTGTCSRCNGRTTITLPKLTTTDYNYSVVLAATCTANGTGRYTWKTTTYGTFSFDVTIPKTDHSYVDIVTTPSCTEGGFTTHTCSICEYSFIDSETSALGHSFGAWTQVKAPTCTESGQISRTCSRCNTTENIDVAALGHTAGEANQENYIAPTCLDEGGYDAVSRCIRCSIEMSREHFTIPSIGHDWENPAYAWADDNSTVTASRICRHDNAHIEMETVTTSSEITIEPSFYSQGEMIVTAVFDAPYFETQTKVVVIPCIENPFEDVPQNAYYYDAVIWAVHHDPQITVGTSSTEFSPNKACTRAQIVTFLWRAAGSPTPEIDEVSFTDVAPTAYFYDAVRWAYEQNITSGTSESSFSPNRACSRSEAVTFLWRTVGSPTATQATTGFIDVSDDIWFSEAVRWAVENSVTVGTSETTFSPNRTCTRAQIVTFLFRVFGESN